MGTSLHRCQHFNCGLIVDTDRRLLVLVKTTFILNKEIKLNHRAIQTIDKVGTR